MATVSDSGPLATLGHALVTGSGLLATSGQIRPPSGFLHNDDVVFYHPLDDSTERTQQAVWLGDLDFTAAVVGAGGASFSGTSFAFGPVAADISDGVQMYIYAWNTTFVRSLASGGRFAVIMPHLAPSPFDWLVGTIDQDNNLTWGSSGAIPVGSIMTNDATSNGDYVFVTMAVGTARQHIVGKASGTTINWGSASSSYDLTSARPYNGSGYQGSGFLGIDKYNNLYIGATDGSSMSWGSAQQYAAGTPGQHKSAAQISAGRIALFYHDESANFRCVIGNVSGSNVTWGSGYSVNGDTAFGWARPHIYKTSVDDQFLCVYHVNGTDTIRAILGQVGGTGSGIIWGSGHDIVTNASAMYQNYGRSLDVATYDGGNRFVVCYKPTGSSYAGFRACVIDTEASGILVGNEQLAISGAAGVDRTSICHVQGAENQFVAVASDWPSAGDALIHAVGMSLETEFGIQAPLSGAYPTVGDASGLTFAFWANTPSSGQSVVIERAHRLSVESDRVTFGTAGVVYSGSSITSLLNGLNDGGDHLAVLHFAPSGASGWTLSTSVDGSGWVEHGAGSGSQPSPPVETGPSIAISGYASGAFVDEVIVWKNTEKFRPFELENLYQLGQAGYEMDDYQDFTRVASGIPLHTFGILGRESVQAPLAVEGAPGSGAGPAASRWGVAELLRAHNHDPQVIGLLDDMGASGDVTITVYELVNMTEVPVANSGCYPIGDTGRWGWSTANLPGDTKHGQHFVYRMASSGGARTFTGEFLLRFPESERGSEKMSVQSPNFREFEYNPDAPQAIVGELTSGASGTVRVWREGVELTLPDNVCTELDGTGRFAWSTAHLPVPTASREQFHWQMDDDQGASDWGDLVRYVPGGDNMMPEPGQSGRYIHQV